MSNSKKRERDSHRRKAAWLAGHDPNYMPKPYSPEQKAAIVTAVVLAACAVILVVSWAHGWRPTP